jgi:fucose 4-O-acetylase-like acetyltransferase
MTERPAPTARPYDAGMANLASVGIVLVVLGHSSPTSLDTVTGVAMAGFRGLLAVISLFHMPLFFFISGYLLVHSHAHRRGENGSYLAFVTGKAKRLLLPYWAISTVAFPLKAWMGSQAARPLEFSLQGYVTSLVVPWQNTIIFFWFLPTLFLLFLAAPLLLRTVAEGSKVTLAAITAALILPALLITPMFWNDPLNYRGAAAHAGTFWLGMLWRARGPALTPAGLAWLGAASLTLFAALGMARHAQVLPNTSIAGAATGLAQAWTGVLATYGLVGWATHLGFQRMPFIHGASFQIYLLSWFPQMFVKIVLFRVLGIGFWPAVVLMFATGLLVPVVLTRAVRRHLPALQPCLGMSA